ncbi:LytTR family DNA-binding domain-containing protein [Herbaspirillum sp. SJZ107]|uniref:LytR/AlgR family response regulator transcription factor n=1 Tax=Herbaspirillum sp. SJZ107 TaxID=2572881 RepID=UPI00114F9A99|nr:LytTR family DNA-binding domain-containing protein [Herbaspirillum sp. SJZ107]TQK02720.1 LytTR family two component transcriptional regulator [Herbaspirillum sp. SJZ107]
MSRPIRVAILDDEPLARLALRTRLAQRPGFELVAEYGDGDSAASGLAAVRPDLVFVDIDMPGKTGIDVLAGLPRAERPMAILLTAYDGFALQAFELAAIDYLLKPVDDERFEEALERAQRAFPYRCTGVAQPASAPAAEWTRTFTVRVGNRIVLVDSVDIERIEADGDYATLHAQGKTYLVRERLQALALRLDPSMFQRVHRSSIVRLDRVVELRALTNRDALLRLRDGTLLRASRTYMPALVQALERRQRADTAVPA